MSDLTIAEGTPDPATLRPFIGRTAVTRGGLRLVLQPLVGLAHVVVAGSEIFVRSDGDAFRHGDDRRERARRMAASTAGAPCACAAAAVRPHPGVDVPTERVTIVTDRALPVTEVRPRA